jgi:HK97 family phage prohead protease
VFGNVDRDGDRIVKGAFAATIDAWQRTGRTLPLHWNHSSAPEDIVGHIDPASMHETDEGLVVKGQLDIDNSDRARQAWRAMKTNSLGLSFGYLTQTGARVRTARTSDWRSTCSRSRSHPARRTPTPACCR